MIDLSVWERESFFAPADVVIAGSGFVGLWSAYYLKKNAPKLSITILERGLIPTGASTRNAGFACFGSLTELVADAAKMGEEKMLDLVEMRYKGLRRIGKVFSNKAIDFQHHGGYELIGNENTDINDLRSHIDKLNRSLKKIVRQQKIFRMSNDKIAEFGFEGVRHLVENQAEGQLHSGKLCQALQQLVQSMGVSVLNEITITSFEKVNGHLLLHTNRGISLSASQLLVCTNAFARQLLPQLDIEPARGQVLVTSPIGDLPFKGTFHYDEGFYYFRNLGDRVLLLCEDAHAERLGLEDRLLGRRLAVQADEQHRRLERERADRARRHAVVLAAVPRRDHGHEHLQPAVPHAVPGRLRAGALVAGRGSRQERPHFASGSVHLCVAVREAVLRAEGHDGH